MRTRLFGWLFGISLWVSLPSVMAQTVSESLDAPARKLSVSEILQDWDRETLLDSLDQERLPRMVTTGVMLNANMSNFIISREKSTMSSYMRVGLEAGGFVDFSLNKHFGIQTQLFISAEQNRFTIEMDSAHNEYGLWQVGMDIPIYFMGRFGNMTKGYLIFGGGLFTHFQFASNVGKPIVYSGDGNKTEREIQREEQQHQLQQSYQDLLKLHNNHFGVCATLGYEFPIGIQINASYRVSLSDICSYYVNSKKTEPDSDARKNSNAAIYPQKISVGVAYRFKHNLSKKKNK